jgi:nicotinamide-nucleotide amidase
MQAIIISIGDELVLGQAVDTNSAWLSAELARLGVAVVEHVTVGDDLERIAASLRRAAAAADVLLVTGGLGPTADDLTRQALAQVLGTPLELHPPSLERIQAFFDRLGREMVSCNRVQAMLPRGAEALENPQGTAPGIKARIGRAVAFFTPGVPSEMKAMFAETIASALRELARQRGGSAAVVSRTLRCLGTGESNLAEMLGELMARGRNPVVNTTVALGIISLRLNASAADEAAGRALIEPVEAQIRRRLGNLIFGVDEESLAGVVGRLLRQRQATLATAESCTGGLLGGEITAVPSASDYFLAGWVTYSNQAKQRLLEVPATLLEQHGAVSAPVAGALAANARRLAGSTHALSITGIAGPAGGTAEKPVGLVYIGLAGPEGVTVERHVFHGDRATIRRRSVHAALNLLRLRLLGA